MTTFPPLPSGYTLVRERVTWTRWDPVALRNRTSRPWQWVLTEPDGHERCFNTKTLAHTWLCENDE